MNKKKSRFNSKIFAAITLFFAVCCLLTTSSWAARKVEFYSANAERFIGKLNQNGSFESISMGPILGLTQDEAFKLLQKRTDFNGVTHYRYQQSFREIPLWGMHTIVSVSPANRVVRLHGAMILDIANDIKGIPASLDPQDALRRMQELHKEKDPAAAWNFTNEKYGTYVYLHNEKAHLCFVVSFFADTECGNPSQPIFFVDVNTDKVLHSFDMLRYAEGYGPGGNLKIGYYYYGTDYPGFGVSVSGSTCTMNTTDVKSVDLNHGTSGTTPYSYTCYENTHKEINGAYCPLNDAQYFGQVVYDMYMDWYGVPVLPFQLSMKVHYGVNVDNAYWTGDSMLFGDGYVIFYPLVGLDVVSHEVGHGFTQYNSDLIYANQSGGINESFSDQAGEGAKYYMRGTNDFMVGYDILKNPTGALRYMYDPPLDGMSIDHVDDYYDGMDVHYSSGIFNKAFYLIATSPGWNTQMAFNIFVKANIDYWQPSTNFQQGAEGARDAALDYGYPCMDVANAFMVVGIPLSCPGGPPLADFVGSPTSGMPPLTVNFTDQSLNNPTSWSWTFEGGTPATSTDQHPTVTYNTTQASPFDVTLVVSNAQGSDTITKYDYITVTDTPIYCSSQGNFQDDEYIGGVQVADLNNPSGPSPYSDFTYMTANMSAGAMVNVTLTPVFASYAYPEYWRIWIDYNNDGDFEDAGEQVFSDNGTTVIYGSFTVQSGVNVVTRMRVSMKYNDYPAPCETFTFGEVEDYTVDIGTAIPAEPDFNNDGRADIIWRCYATGCNALWLRGTATTTASAAGISSDKNNMSFVDMKNAGLKGEKGKILDNADMNISIEELREQGVIDGFEGYTPVTEEGTNPLYDPFEIESSQGVSRTMATVSDPRDDPEAVDLPTAANTQWKLCGAGDFSGNGKPDLVWRHLGNGTNAVWFMDGVTRTSVEWLPSTANLDWTLCGIGDFNNDGKPDLVWRHVGNGKNAVWFMDGLTRLGVAWLPTAVNLDWTLCGTGDFDNDGNTDLVWRHVGNGTNAVWFMDGVTRTSVGSFPPATNLDWTLCGAGDFNNDGKMDLLWRNVSSGSNAVWYMDGLIRIGVDPLTTVTGTTWKIEN